MSKKHRTNVPDFSSNKTPPRAPDAKLVKGSKPSAPTTAKVKPQATSAKSGRRGS